MAGLCATIRQPAGILSAGDIAMATLPAFDLARVLKGVPRGAWVAISEEKEEVISFGADMRTVLDEARRKGEKDPLMTRVPESNTTLIL
jgi:hypothetical protein